MGSKKGEMNLLTRHGILLVMVLGLAVSIIFNILQLREQPVVVEITSVSPAVVGQGVYVGPTPAIVSFEWGKVPGGPYPYETPPTRMKAPGPLEFKLIGLSPGTTYYYRAKAMFTQYGVEGAFTTLSEWKEE